MKLRQFAALCTLLATTLSAAEAPATALPVATILKKTSVTVGSAKIALTPGTKLEILGREGDALLVKFRSTKGKVPLADTDFKADTPLPEAAPVTAPVVHSTPTAPAAKPAVPAPATATPPALNTSGQGVQPGTNYGKAVQKAKLAAEANKSTHVDPTKGIMDDEPKK